MGSRLRSRQQVCGRICAVGKVDQALIRRLLADADRLEGRKKGDALESAVRALLGSIPGLELIAADLKDTAGAEELDLGYINDGSPDGLRHFGPDILVECKNWNEPVGAPQVGWFVHKLQNAQQSIGILVATKGLTGDREKRSAALHEIDMARASHPRVNVVVLTREEIELIPDSRSLVRLLHSKLFHVRTGGRIHVANREELLNSGDSATGSMTGQAVADATGSGPSGMRPESMNARTLRATDIARQFVPNLASRQLARPCNSILVGPRGSGRTTLLRSLTIEVDEMTFGATFSDADASPAFTGIYVSASMLPHSFPGQHDPFGHEAVVRAAIFTSAVLRATAMAVDHQIRQLVNQARRTAVEQLVAATICEVQGLGNEVPRSLRSVADELDLRIRELASAARAERYSGGPAASSLEFQDVRGSDLHYAMRKVTDVANEALGDPGHQWCLLVDEVELAGPALVETLLEMMGDSSDQLLVKMALGPHSAHNTTRTSPSAEAGRHYDVVVLPPADAGRWARKFLDQTARVSDTRRIALRNLRRSGWEDSEGAARRAANVLAERDESFRAWASARGVMGDDLVGRVALRRAWWHILLREHYLGTGGRGLRARRSLTPYSSTETLIRLLSEQPRALQAYVNDFLDRVAEGEYDSPVLRSLVLESVVERYVAVIGNVLGGEVLRLIDKIGSGMQVRFYGNFSLYSPLAFLADDKISRQDQRHLEVAMELGAVCPVRQSGFEGGWGIRNGPMRLAWILMPRYKLPLQAGRATRLSELITASA